MPPGPVPFAFAVEREAAVAARGKAVLARVYYVHEINGLAYYNKFATVSAGLVYFMSDQR